MLIYGCIKWSVANFLMWWLFLDAYDKLWYVLTYKSGHNFVIILRIVIFNLPYLAGTLNYALLHIKPYN